MLADTGRVQAFVTALQQRLLPGQTILDIGTGTGIWAFAACRLGARRVYAVEPDDIIDVAKRAAVVNGYGDRIEFIRNVTRRIGLPEKVDGIVADIRGALPLYNGSLGTLIDARTRFLKPGGWMIPARDTLWAALVHDPEGYHQSVGFWDSRPLDFDLSEFRRSAAGEWGRRDVSAERLISAPAKWATIEYASIAEPNAHGVAAWRIDQSTVAHGLCVWFDMEDECGSLSNSPLSPEKHVYSRTFFPWKVPVDLAKDDLVDVELKADPVGDEYLWRWNANVRDAEGRMKLQFRQSTLDGAHFSLEDLRKRAHLHQPALNLEGEIDRMILDRFGDGSTLESIARDAAARFPNTFSSWQKALTRVGELSAQYSK